jgi:predicted homoserine dehydrogenase-like protein
MELVRKLRERQAAGRPVAVGIVGCGQMGSGVAHAVMKTPGMRVRALADIDLNRALDTFADLGFPRSEIVVASTVAEAEDGLHRGRGVVTEDALLLPQLESVEANVEATGVTEVGARVAWESIRCRRPIILLNVETDVTVGYLLNHQARRQGCVYTVASGDEPGVCTMLYEQAVLMGFTVVCLGKGKNNPIDWAATPASCEAEAKSKGMNPKILASFKDGTKTMVEMAAVANATGLCPDIPGMHGPQVELPELKRVFVPRSEGGIFSGPGRVDYSTGAIAPGVFAIVHTDDARIRKDMRFITREDGPYYLLFRPYHLCDIETPQSIAEAVLLGERTATASTFAAEVVAVAKRDLMPGERVGDIGGADFLGRIYRSEDALRQRAVPLGIAPGGTVQGPIARGGLLTAENFCPDASTFVFQLRLQQDALRDAEQASRTHALTPPPHTYERPGGS